MGFIHYLFIPEDSREVCLTITPCRIRIPWCLKSVFYRSRNEYTIAVRESNDFPTSTAGRSTILTPRCHRDERLQGPEWGIRINDQGRICFEWDKSARGSANVEIVDYR